MKNMADEQGTHPYGAEAKPEQERMKVKVKIRDERMTVIPRSEAEGIVASLSRERVEEMATWAMQKNPGRDGVAALDLRTGEVGGWHIEADMSFGPPLGPLQLVQLAKHAAGNEEPYSGTLDAEQIRVAFDEVYACEVDADGNAMPFLSAYDAAEAGKQDDYVKAVGGFVVADMGDGTYGYFPDNQPPHRDGQPLAEYRIVLGYRWWPSERGHWERRLVLDEEGCEVFPR